MRILIVSIYINMTENSTHLNEPYQSTIVTVIGSYSFWFTVTRYGPSVTSNGSRILNQDSSASNGFSKGLMLLFLFCRLQWCWWQHHIGGIIMLVTSFFLFTTSVSNFRNQHWCSKCKNASAKLTKQNDCISLSNFFTMFKSKFGPLGVILFTT